MSKEKPRQKSTRMEVDAMKPIKDDLVAKSIFLDKEKLRQLKEEVHSADPKDKEQLNIQVLRAVIHMAALGIPNGVIAKSIGVPSRRVSTWMRSSSIQREVEKAQLQHFERDNESMFKRLVPTAVQTMFDLLVSAKTKDSVRTEIAKYMVDRAHGKPVERIESKTDLVGEVFAALQKGRNDASQNRPIEADFTEVNTDSNSANSDPLADLLKD